MLKEKIHYILITVLAALLYVFLSIKLKNPSPVFDVWFHLASLRELIWHPGDISHPFFSIYEPVRDYAPYYYILSKLSVIWGRDVFLTFKIGGLLTFIIYSVSLCGFLGRVFNFDSKMKALALLSTLFLWGAPWMWSAVYSFNTLTITAGYPSFFGFSVSIASIYFLHGYLYQDSYADLLAGMVLFYLFFVTYPAILPFYLINVALLAPKDKKKVLSLLPPFLFVFTASLLWPLFPLISTVTDMFNFAVEAKQYPFQPMALLRQIWPALLGGYAVFSLRGAGRFYRRGFILCALLGAMTLTFNIDLWGRFLLFSLFYLQLGFSVYIAQVSISPGNFRRLLSPDQIRQKVLGTFLFIIFCYQISTMWRGNRIELKIPLESYEKIVSFVDDREVVMSGPATGWPLPAYGVKVVAPVYPALGGYRGRGGNRQKDVLSFMASPEKASRGREILSKYQAGYILINNKTGNYERFTRFGEVIYSDDFLVLIRVVNKGS